MGNPLRGSSLFALLLFAGWSLFVNARERLAPQRSSPERRAAPAPSAPPAAADRLLWN
jgi:hypothetical protein